MTKKEMVRRYEQESRLIRNGFSAVEAEQLRRISNTLRSWYEHECNGDIERSEVTDKPMRMYDNGHKRVGYPIRDRELGADRRLAAIMKKHPSFVVYHQTDPRGASLYLLPVDKLGSQNPDNVYNSIGICVY